jgi:hypothetical protein
MIRVLSWAIFLASLALSAQAQDSESDRGHAYLSGESYYPYAYQRHSDARSSDYGYQHPANSYAYPNVTGEHYSPYSYNGGRGYQDR